MRIVSILFISIIKKERIIEEYNVKNLNLKILSNSPVILTKLKESIVIQ